jgi:hypothetical protein
MKLLLPTLILTLALAAPAQAAPRTMHCHNQVYREAMKHPKAKIRPGRCFNEAKNTIVNTRAAGCVVWFQRIRLIGVTEAWPTHVVIGYEFRYWNPTALRVC